MDNLDERMLASASRGDLIAVEKLVLQGANIDHTNAWGDFAMFSAAWEGNTQAMDLF